MGTVPLQGGQRRQMVAEDKEEHCCVSVSVEDTHYSLYNAFLQGRSCPFPIILQSTQLKMWPWDLCGRWWARERYSAVEEGSGRMLKCGGNDRTWRWAETASAVQCPGRKDKPEASRWFLRRLALRTFPQASTLAAHPMVGSTVETNPFVIQ